MKTTSRSLPKFDVLQKSEGLSVNQDCFPYLLLLLFRDNFYSVACKRCLNRRSINLVFGACSAAATKRSIDSVRYQDYSEIFYSEFVRKRSSRLSIDLYLHVLLQTICLILGIPLLCRLAAETNNNSKISQSIHSIFLFLEDRLPKSSHVLEMDMSQNLHLETLVRLFRRQIRDVPFLHLLRIVLHTYKTLCGKFIQFRSWKQKERRSIDMLLQNFYIYEVDLILLVLWTRIHKSNPICFVSSDQNNMTRKKICVSEYSSQLDAISIDRCLTRSLCIHFGRCKNKSFIAFHGTQYFLKKWIYYVSIFFQYHFHYPIEFTQIRINLLSASCVLFLGYISAIHPVSKNVRVETTVDSYNSILGEKEFHPRVPISRLVKLMEREKFCDSTGHPVSKLAWTVLTDDEILNRFVKIWNTFSSYHSASINRDGLRRLRYILRLSCDSTLAGKHRGTIRFLRRRFDRELSKTVSTSNKLNSFEINQRIWHLSLIQSVSLKYIALNIQV
uniref:maturase K n=1 Tax=Brainea insignis TaxID=120713 RepID=UPI001EDD0CEC|nr:maturase K [Brainea insignis]QKV47330.1 maturase K [Brainea insignis]UIF93898.1 maturase K [Brainea insignis]